MIVEKQILELGLEKAKKRAWISCNDYFLKNINPNYGYFLYCTFHVPTEIWQKSGRENIEDNMCKIILHRFYNVEDPMKYWDLSFKQGESVVVYKGYIHSGTHLKKLLKDTGIIE